jgi:uncharacterized protein YkwD
VPARSKGPRRGASLVLAGALLVVTGRSGAAPQAAPELAAWSASPLPIDDAGLDDVERDALARCGRGESGLRDVARALLARKLAGGNLPELDGIAREQRAAGEPHPWPRAFSARVRSLSSPQARDATLARLETWLGAAAVPLRRCGIATGVAPDGSHALVVVTVEALADLAPLPTRARTGQWLTLEAHLRTAASKATVFVMDASGAPRTVPSWIEGSVVRARFAADQPGELDVQVVADVPGGPRPVLEATVFVDVDPPHVAAAAGASDVPAAPAPGEAEDGASGGSGPAPDDVRLARMMAAARSSVGLSSLPRDPRLDRLALDHASRMAATHELAHDAGDGDPLERMRQAGLDPHLAGENVAHAATLPLAHRAIWASPSHRLNLLGRGYDRMGVGVVRDDRGELWVVETFAGGL